MASCGFHHGAFRQRIHPQKIRKFLSVGTIISLVDRSNRLEHCRMGYLQLHGIGLEKIIDSTGEHGCFHCPYPRAGKIHEPFPKRSTFRFHHSLADNSSSDGFDAVSNRFLVYIQANVVNTFHRVPPCGSD